VVNQVGASIVQDSRAIGELSFPNLRHHNVCFLLVTCAVLILYWKPVASIVALSLQEGQEHYSHISLIPFVCGYLLYAKRKVILARVQWNPWVGLPLVGIGITLFLFAQVGRGEGVNEVSLTMLSMVIAFWGTFLFCYGTRALRAAWFELGFLVFIVPLPSFLLDAIVGFLQRSSAEATDALFSVLGIPVFRDGFVFSLSNFAIHVAEECSGIRSALSLFITGLVAGQLFLRSAWGRMGLVSIVVPLAIVKNAVRIVGLALLANYIDPRFVTDSALHRNGGVPLFLASLAMLFSFVWLVRRLEKHFGYSPGDGRCAKG
jgi:exosortase